MLRGARGFVEANRAAAALERTHCGAREGLQRGSNEGEALSEPRDDGAENLKLRIPAVWGGCRGIHFGGDTVERDRSRAATDFMEIHPM